MKVKCQFCGKQIEQEAALKIIIKGKNKYYCSQEEYKQHQIHKKIRSITYKIFGGTHDYQYANYVIKHIKNNVQSSELIKYLNKNLDILHTIYTTSTGDEHHRIDQVYYHIINDLGQNLKIIQYKEYKLLYKYNDFGNNGLCKKIIINGTNLYKYNTEYNNIPYISDLENIIGVYQFLLCGEVVYIGSSFNLLNRLQNHVKEIKLGNNYINSDISNKKYYYFNKYIDDLQFEILATYDKHITKSMLLTYEYSYINSLFPIFNVVYGGHINKWSGTDEDIEDFVYGLLTMNDLRNKLLYRTKKDLQRIENVTKVKMPQTPVNS